MLPRHAVYRTPSIIWALHYLRLALNRSPWGSPAARSRGLLPVTPRQACPVAPASSLFAAGRAPCQPPGEGLGRRAVASTIQRVHSKRDCGKIAFEIPILFGRCETVRHL